MTFLGIGIAAADCIAAGLADSDFLYAEFDHLLAA